MSTRTTDGYYCQLVQKSKREGRGEKKQNDNCKILALHANAKKKSFRTFAKYQKAEAFHTNRK